MAPINFLSLSIWCFQEQVRDLMVFLDAQQNIAVSPLKEELREGSASVGAVGHDKKSKKKRAGR